ncbi:hypothetical protein BD413DRAFT_495798 [Trametes elegans]|nr:hypothetical protein BD413DRAFT_495798 [Trametes elegans]
MKYAIFVSLALALSASASPRFHRRASFTQQNGRDALALNQKFATLNANSPCTAGENACVNNEFAQCVNGKFVLQPCAGGLICAALPLVNSAGTSITCTTAADRDARIAATGASAGSNNAVAGGAAASQAAGGKGASSAAPDKVASSVAATGKGVGGAATSKGAAATATATGKGAGAAAGAKDAGGRGAGGKGAGGKGAGAASTVVGSSAAASSTVAAASSVAASATASAVKGSSAAGASSTAAAGNNAAGGKGAAAGGDAQTSLTLVDSVIATGFANNGQDQPTAGQVPSLTSNNNFINFCATVPQLPITNGKQVKTGSCNPAPMGVIASVNNMPSSKFVNPKNGATIPANKNFTIQMAINNLETGHFTNALQNYFAAPQVVNAQGNIQGHSHVVIDKLTALDQTTPTDPLNGFVFFKGLNDVAQGGILSTVVPGLPAGAYRLASINAAANHQPALVAIAQHGSLDDMVYFTVA